MGISFNMSSAEKSPKVKLGGHTFFFFKFLFPLVWLCWHLEELGLAIVAKCGIFLYFVENLFCRHVARRQEPKSLIRKTFNILLQISLSVGLEEHLEELGLARVAKWLKLSPGLPLPLAGTHNSLSSLLDGWHTYSLLQQKQYKLEFVSKQVVNRRVGWYT